MVARFFMNLPQAQAAMLEWVSQQGGAQLKLLLETKHLYQRTHIDESELKKAAESIVSQMIWRQDIRQAFSGWVDNELPAAKFTLIHHELSAAMGGAARSASLLNLVLPNPGVYCRNCKRREAFAPVWFSDVSGEVRTALASGVSKAVRLPESLQILLLLYQCQRCLSAPEGFLIRREGWVFGLQGRSPMELIEVPAFIPQPEARFYRDALIAFGTGKKLAAVFYLRTFIEQFARRVTRKVGRATGEAILDAYYEGLPQEHKGHMPSLREWYDKLSEAMHSAREDDALYEAAKREIERHFDIRRVFNLGEEKSDSPSDPERRAAKG